MTKSKNASSRPLHVTDVMEAAWQRYQAGLEEVRHILYNHPFSAKPRARNAANYLFHQIQAAAFNLAIAPTPHYPRFFFHTFFNPVGYTFIGPNPDFAYTAGFLDGSRTYRISGKRSNSQMVLMQSLNGYFTYAPEQMKMIGNYDLDEFKIDADGSFEITASAAKAPGNWIPLDPTSDRNVVFVREAFGDWNVETRTIFNAEVIDDLPNPPITLDDDAMAARLDQAVLFMRYCIAEYSQKVIEDVAGLGGWNQFAVPRFNETHKQAAASPHATYNVMAYEVKDDEAIIIELSPPESLYWGCQLTDEWDQTIDYTYHQSSLNAFQTYPDLDGRVRIVLSVQDPGVHNWITPLEARAGSVVVRWYGAKAPSVPQARSVSFAALAKELPPETKRVTAEQRRAEIRKRTAAILKRYNYGSA